MADFVGGYSQDIYKIDWFKWNQSKWSCSICYVFRFYSPNIQKKKNIKKPFFSASFSVFHIYIFFFSWTWAQFKRTSQFSVCMKTILVFWGLYHIFTAFSFLLYHIFITYRNLPFPFSLFANLWWTICYNKERQWCIPYLFLNFVNHLAQ